MLKWLKNLVILVLIVIGTLYVADYQWKGKTVRQYFQDAYKSGLLSEGMKDIKTWITDMFKAGKKVASDEVSPKDKEALERIIKNELKENVMKLKEESVEKNKR